MQILTDKSTVLISGRHCQCQIYWPGAVENLTRGLILSVGKKRILRNGSDKSQRGHFLTSQPAAESSADAQLSLLKKVEGKGCCLSYSCAHYKH